MADDVYGVDAGTASERLRHLLHAIAVRVEQYDLGAGGYGRGNDLEICDRVVNEHDRVRRRRRLDGSGSQRLHQFGGVGRGVRVSGLRYRRR